MIDDTGQQLLLKPSLQLRWIAISQQNRGIKFINQLPDPPVAQRKPCRHRPQRWNDHLLPVLLSEYESVDIPLTQTPVQLHPVDPARRQILANRATMKPDVTVVSAVEERCPK